MQRYALIIQYDGSQFYGWQKQADGIPTVQGALENALFQIAGEPIQTIAAGRTDTGVHACAQVVHFDSNAHRPLQAWVRGVNAFLPSGVAVIRAQTVAPEFHARFDASGRHYRYLLQSSAVRSPLFIGKMGWTHYPLALQPMQEAVQYLLGEHDFSSFRASQCQAKSPVKTIYQAAIHQKQQLFYLDLHGNAFLHHMVRNIIGTLVYVGSKRMTPSEFAQLIELKSRTFAPPTFMADGLYFTGVDYPPKWQIQFPDTQNFGII